jgi:hypothetical protein
MVVQVDYMFQGYCECSQTTVIKATPFFPYPALLPSLACHQDHSKTYSEPWCGHETPDLLWNS